MSVSLTRLRAELKMLKTLPKEIIEVKPIDEKDLYHWKAYIRGPENSPFEGGVFGLDIVFKKDYPFSPPSIKFLNKVYHPNVNSKGDICLDILASKWSPGLFIDKVLISISSFLADPNSEHYLEPSIANIYTKNKAKYNETAKLWTKLYAK